MLIRANDEMHLLWKEICVQRRIIRKKRRNDVSKINTEHVLKRGRVPSLSNGKLIDHLLSFTLQYFTNAYFFFKRRQIHDASMNAFLCICFVLLGNSYWQLRLLNDPAVNVLLDINL